MEFMEALEMEFSYDLSSVLDQPKIDGAEVKSPSSS